jgi:hypothetical protein
MPKPGQSVRTRCRSWCPAVDPRAEATNNEEARLPNFRLTRVMPCFRGAT